MLAIMDILPSGLSPSWVTTYNILEGEWFLESQTYSQVLALPFTTRMTPDNSSLRSVDHSLTA